MRKVQASQVFLTNNRLLATGVRHQAIKSGARLFSFYQLFDKFFELIDLIFKLCHFR
jgi:hypothetical protein